MIPKIIHYCWFGRGEIPPIIRWCIDGWKKIMPNYEYKLWNEDNFDVYSTEWTRTAYEAKKYAFVADYVRLYALCTEGGIALDADMKVLKPFDKFLKYSFVSAIELNPTKALQHRNEIDTNTLLPLQYEENVRNLGMTVAAGVMMSIPQHPYIESCLSFYNSHSFSLDNMMNLILNGIIARKAEDFGFRYTAAQQYLKEYDMIIYEPDVFVFNSLHLNSNTYAIHLGANSWRTPSQALSRKGFFGWYFFKNYILRTKLRHIKDKFRTYEELERVYAYSLYI